MTGTVREYLYAGGEAPTAMRARQSDGSYKNYFYLTNTHGDVVALTDKDGVIVNRYAYGPWGEATRVSESVHQPFRYAGYRYEDGFDLYYLRARWMDPGSARFLSRDPMAGALQNLVALNLYLYGHDSPATKTDPSGYGPRRPIVIAYLHGISAPRLSIERWVEELQTEFPNSEVFAPDYGIGPINAITGDESQVKRIADDFRCYAAGRQLFALGHSWGGVAIFKAASEYTPFVRVAITMGAPIAEKASQWVGSWIAFCGDNEWACDPTKLRFAMAAGIGPNELLVPAGVGHSDYQNRDDVKRAIYERFRRFGAE